MKTSTHRTEPKTFHPITVTLVIESEGELISVIHELGQTTGDGLTALWKQLHQYKA